MKEWFDAEYEAAIKKLWDKIDRRDRQLALARRLLRRACGLMEMNEVYRRSAAEIRREMLKLDDRTAKRRKR